MIIYFSAVLGRELRGQGQSRRVVDPETGMSLPTSRELERFLELEKKHAQTEKERADREKARASTEKDRADAAEKELFRLREEQARLR